MTLLDEAKVHLDALGAANRAFMQTYPGDRAARQPVHTVYGGAQLFKAETTSRLGAVARATLDTYGRTPADFARGVGFTADPGRLAGDDRPRARAAQARTRAGRGLPHRLRGRLRRPPRRRGGRDRDRRRARGRAGHARRARCRRSSASASSRSARSGRRAAPARSRSSSTPCSARPAAACPPTSWSRCPRSRSPSSRGRWCGCSRSSSAATAWRKARCGWR